ncbi:hypothetical protein EJ08DRAFT_68567 [Tothia fuscella]|uniref:Glycine zipper 2TM domain-containing protein n=1 Tax=Tothia fuscella TaxID=1048955 RepID=A0A9P4NEQ2_9PEZI|nr:hypothetical protein EJ08DRAFT_68567 [Tothia fuscella]
MAALALKALNLGAEKIPDAAFHAKKDKAKKDKSDRERERRHHERDPRDDRDARDDRENRDERDHRDRREEGRYSQRRYPDSRQNSESSSDDSDEEARPEREPPRRKNRRYQRSSHLDRGYDSDSRATPDGYQHQSHYKNASRSGYPVNAPPPSATNYFPPPPRYAVGEEPQLHQPSSDYHPHKYAAPEGQRDNYYAGHPKERQPYDPALYEEPPLEQPTAQQPRSNLYPPTMDPSERSSSADRYRPTEYQPNAPSSALASYAPQPYLPSPPMRGNANAQLSSAQAAYSNQQAVGAPIPYDGYGSPVPRGSTYTPPVMNSPPLSPEPEQHRSSHRSRSHRRDKSRGKSRNDGRSKSRRDSMREKLEPVRDKLEQNKDVGASALGALAGGLLGNQVGHGRHGRISTLVGAALGGVAGNLAEKKYGDCKDDKKRHSSRRSYYEEDRGYDSY